MYVGCTRRLYCCCTVQWGVGGPKVICVQQYLFFDIKRSFLSNIGCTVQRECQRLTLAPVHSSRTHHSACPQLASTVSVHISCPLKTSSPPSHFRLPSIPFHPSIPFRLPRPAGAGRRLLEHDHWPSLHLRAVFTVSNPALSPLLSPPSLRCLQCHFSPESQSMATYTP